MSMPARAADEPDAGGIQPADARREQLLDAALAVIAERGFPETRIADVAARAGISPALVIYYFKTRDQLLTEAIRLSEDRWYADGTARIAELTTAAERLEELVAMSCLPDSEGDVSWVIWLDLWAQAARHPEVAAVRQEFDEHWRRTITEVVVDGQRSGEFTRVDSAEFAIALSALLDGFAVQSALEDPVVDGALAFRISMQFAAAQLGFAWTPPKRRQRRSNPAPARRRPRREGG